MSYGRKRRRCPLEIFFMRHSATLQLELFGVEVVAKAGSIAGGFVSEESLALQTNGLQVGRTDTARNASISSPGHALRLKLFLQTSVSEGLDVLVHPAASKSLLSKLSRSPSR
jgi:hypothetical protein